jgi:N-acyl-D-amino-acid deacylase
MSELKAYLKIINETDAKADVLMYKYANPAIIERLRMHPLSLYMTDAWVNEQGVQNFAIYYNFPKFILLAKKSGTPVEQAINKMTGATAEQYNIPGRGFIKEGKKADLTIFSPDKLNYTEGREDSPSGIEYVFINGKMVLKHGEILRDAYNAGEFIKV